jgi:hypothetical protein
MTYPTTLIITALLCNTVVAAPQEVRRAKVSDAVDYAKFFSRSHDALIRVYEADVYENRAARTHII